MGRFHESLAKFRRLLGSSDSVQDEKTVFVVPDEETGTAASRALARVRIPNAPHLRTLEEAYTIGDKVLRALNSRSIKVVERRGMSKEESYAANEETIRRLVSQRDAIATIIDNMLHPLIRVVGDISIRQQAHYGKLAEYEKRIAVLERMMAEVYGRAPVVPPLPGGKALWGATLKEAAVQIKKEYDQDCKSSIRRFRSLRDASDDFHRRHLFVHKPNLTSDQLYENVKKL